MPALEAFGRKWRIGSDDLVFPGLFEVIIRSCWLIFTIALLVKHLEPQDDDDDSICKEGVFLLIVYLIGVIVLLCLTIILSIVLVHQSAQGTIMNTASRKNVPIILGARLILGIVEVSWNIFGTIWLYSNRVKCDTSSLLWIFTEVLVVITWVALPVFIIIVFFLFEPMMRPDENEGLEIHHESLSPYRKLWEKRFRLLCCSFSSKDDDNSTEAFRSIADLFSKIFEDNRYVGSDIAAALVLLRIQRKTQEAAMKCQFSSPQNFEIPPPEWMNLKNANHFMKFALGSYGWAWLVYGRLIRGSISLWNYIKCCSCCCSTSSGDIKDNCCMCNMGALKQITGLPSENFVFVSFHNHIYETPYYVAIDDETNNIVIAIRGTLSLHDAMTDFSAQSTNLHYEDLPEGSSAHKGMVAAAEFVRKKLEETQVIELALNSRPDYNLVITGHSLGAGTAVVLACMLRSQYPQIKCYSFSPPGASCSKELSVYLRDFVFSVIIGDDLVPRLSIDSVQELYRKISYVLHACRKPKYRILASGFWYLFFGISESSVEALTPIEHTSQDDLITSEEGICNYNAVRDRSPVRINNRTNHTPLYPPGRILHVQHVFHDKNKKWESVWEDCCNFQDIHISPRMMKDHLPHHVLRVLTEVEEGEIAEIDF